MSIGEKFIEIGEKILILVGNKDKRIFLSIVSIRSDVLNQSLFQYLLSY